MLRQHLSHAQVAEGLRTLMLGLYDVHLAPDGRRVDYPALVRDPNFADYVTAATELQKVRCGFAPMMHPAALFSCTSDVRAAGL